MPKVIDLFEVFYGTNLELNKLKQVNDETSGIHYVSRTRKNNGVSAIVEPYKDKEPLESGLITVAVGSSSVMESFVQPKPFYTGRDVYCLRPKREMTLEEKIFYCSCLRHNKFKYNYGRQANKTLEFIELPDELPEWVQKTRSIDISKLKNKLINEKVTINTEKWKSKKCSELFDVKGGKSITVGSAALNPGRTPLISGTRYDNGIKCYTNYEPTHTDNVLSVAKNGSICEAFYQDKPFCRTGDVWVLYPKFEFDKYIALFFATLIRREKYRYNYGRKLNKDLMEDMEFKVPVKDNDEIDIEYIRNLIKKIKYSASI